MEVLLAAALWLFCVGLVVWGWIGVVDCPRPPRREGTDD